MKWFCKASVCRECGVYFDTRGRTRHPKLCAEHCKPVMELEDRASRVVEWARMNWLNLEAQCIAEEEKRNAAAGEAFQKMANSLYNMYGAAQPSVRDTIGRFGL